MSDVTEATLAYICDVNGPDLIQIPSIIKQLLLSISLIRIGSDMESLQMIKM